MILSVKNLNRKQFDRIADALASKFSRGGVLGLVGELGSGKTTFAKRFARHFGIRKITSPTFTIINSVSSKRLNFYHIDLYRLSRYAQLKPLGLDEVLSDPKAVVLIEWA